MASSEVGRRIELFCNDIVVALWKPWLSPEERRRQEEEAAQRAEDDRRREEEAEAKSGERKTNVGISRPPKRSSGPRTSVGARRSPTTARRSGSIQNTRMPTTIGGLQNEPKAIPREAMPTSPRRSD